MQSKHGGLPNQRNVWSRENGTHLQNCRLKDTIYRVTMESLWVMVSAFGKGLIVATSLAPVCGAFAVNIAAHSPNSEAVARNWKFWTLIATGLALTFVAVRFLNWAKTNLKQTEIRTATVRQTDKDVLAFLMAYLLPLIGKDGLSIGNPLIALYAYSLVFIAIYHSNSFHFNPMLSMIGYHFYEVQTEEGYGAIVVSKGSHMMQKQCITVVKIAPFLLLTVQDEA